MQYQDRSVATMSNGRLVRRIGGATGAIAMLGGAATVFGGAGPALAAPGETCEPTTPTATLIADGVCELRITTSGTYTFPTSITKLSAVLVGAGAGGRGVATGDYAGFGGGGGAVTYVDSVALGVPVTATIGIGGSPDTVGGNPGASGGTTTLDAASAAGGGASGGAAGGSSGSGELGSSQAGPAQGYGPFGSGGGAGSAAPDGATPGSGVTLSSVATDASLFPAALDGTDVLGAGGTAASTSSALAPVVANSGQGGSAVAGDNGSVGPFIYPQTSAGANGMIVMRFPATPPVQTNPGSGEEAPQLAESGTTASDAALALVGATASLAGGALVAGSRRMRTRRRS